MPAGIRKTPISVTCAQCGLEFEWWACTTVKYCSAACRQKFGYWRNVEKRRERNRNRYPRYSKAIQAAQKQKRKEDPEKYKKSSRDTYLKNREKYIQAAVQWQKDNPEKVKIRNGKRKAREQGYLVTKKDLSRQQHRQRNECIYCGVRMSPPGRKDPTSLQWDHVMPLSKGGKHSKGNLVACCRDCNLRKHSRLLRVWLKPVS